MPMNINCPSCDNRVGNYELSCANEKRLCPSCGASLIELDFVKPKGYILYKVLYFILWSMAVAILVYSFFESGYFQYPLLIFSILMIIDCFHRKRVMKGWTKWKLDNEKSI